MFGCHRPTLFHKFRLSFRCLVKEGCTKPGSLRHIHKVMGDCFRFENLPYLLPAIAAEETSHGGLLAQGLQNFCDIDGFAGGTIKGRSGSIYGVEDELLEEHDSLGGRGWSDAKDHFCNFPFL